MKRFRRIVPWLVTLVLMAGLPLAARAAEEAPAKEEHHITLNAARLAQFGPYHLGGHEVGPFFITNSMLVTWIAALFIIISAQYAMRDVKEVPDGAQNFWEWLVEQLYNLLEGIIGHDLVRKTFWFFASIFILILCSNWIGLIPGVGTIGWGPPSGPFRSIEYVASPLFRGANADFNMTFAMAIVFFLMWIIWAFQANGVGGFIMHLFGPKGETTGFVKVIMIFIFIVAGFLEIISILFRPVSLSFRLYGNIFAGENMMDAMANIVQHPDWLRHLCAIVIPIPFYFMELLVGLVQAMVFMLLTAVFTLLICQHSDESHGTQHH